MHCQPSAGGACTCNCRTTLKSHLQYHSRGSKPAICHAGARQANQAPRRPAPRPHDQRQWPNPLSAMSESDAEIVEEGAYISARGLRVIAPESDTVVTRCADQTECRLRPYMACHVQKPAFSLLRRRDRHKVAHIRDPLRIDVWLGCGHHQPRAFSCCATRRSSTVWKPCRCWGQAVLRDSVHTQVHRICCVDT